MWVYFTRFSIEKSNVITNLQANLMPTSNFNYIVVKKSGFSMRHAIMYLLTHLIIFILQVNLCQKLLFLHQLTHNMTTDCSLNYKFHTCFVHKLFFVFTLKTIYVQNMF